MIKIGDPVRIREVAQKFSDFQEAASSQLLAIAADIQRLGDTGKWLDGQQVECLESITDHYRKACQALDSLRRVAVEMRGVADQYQALR